jgi:hypothetical protein
MVDVAPDTVSVHGGNDGFDRFGFGQFVELLTSVDARQL